MSKALKRSSVVLAALILLAACAHTPTAAEKAMGVAQKVDAVALEVMELANQVIQKEITDTHLYNQAAKAYNDTLHVLKEYDRLVKIAEETGNTPPLEQAQEVVKVVMDFIKTLGEMGVDVSKLKEKALSFYGG